MISNKAIAKRPPLLFMGIVPERNVENKFELFCLVGNHRAVIRLETNIRFYKNSC